MFIFMDASNELNRRLPSLGKKTNDNFIVRVFIHYFSYAACICSLLYSHWSLKKIKKHLSTTSSAFLLERGNDFAEQIAGVRDELAKVYHSFKSNDAIPPTLLTYIKEESEDWGEFAEDLAISSNEKCQKLFKKLGDVLSNGTK